MYVTKGMEGGHPKCLEMRTRGEGYRASCASTHLHFSCFCHLVLCFICRNLNLRSLKKGVFARNCYFSSMRLISFVKKSAFFTLNYFSEPKLAKTVLIRI